MDLNTGRAISRRKVVEIPITTTIIKAVEALAATQKVKSLKITNRRGIVLSDSDVERTGVNYPDEEVDDDDEDDYADKEQDDIDIDKEIDEEIDENEIEELLGEDEKADDQEENEDIKTDEENEPVNESEVKNDEDNE